MRKATIYQPFATQFLVFKLKFWFAAVDPETDEVRRYELAVERHSNNVRARYRAFDPNGTPNYGSNFYEYLVPKNFMDSPSLSFPRFKGDKFADAAKAILSEQQIADFASFRLVGIISPQPKPEGSLLPLFPTENDNAR